MQMVLSCCCFSSGPVTSVKAAVVIEHDDAVDDVAADVTDADVAIEALGNFSMKP